MFQGLQNILRRAAPEEKASRAGAIVALHQAGRPVWTPRDYAALAREGFMRNAIVFRCVRMIAEAAGSVPLLIYNGGRELDTHPLLSLLSLLVRPNGRQSGAAFLETLIGHLLVAGNAYAEAAVLDGVPRELHVLRPDRMKVVPGADGWPEAYEYTVGAETVRFRQTDGVPPILHFTFFHPLDDHYGLSPKPPRRRSTCTMPLLPGTRRCSTMRRGLRARSSIQGRTARTFPKNSSRG